LGRPRLEETRQVVEVLGFADHDRALPAAGAAPDLAVDGY
jgi:hypothetical protein